MPNEEILLMKDRIVSQLSPLQVYLFGSYAYGTPGPDSDYDFYIVVDDDKKDWHAQTVKAYKAIRSIRTKPVDILVGTKSDFEKRKRYSSIEREVAQKGVLIYGVGQGCQDRCMETKGGSVTTGIVMGASGESAGA